MSDREEEYQMPSGVAKKANTQLPEGPSMMMQIFRRFALVTVGLIIFTFLFHFFTGSGKKKVEAEKTKVAAQKQQAVPKEKASRPMETVQVTTKDIADIKSQLNELRGLYLAEKSQIYQIEVGIRHIEDAIAGIDALLSELKIKVQTMQSSASKKRNMSAAQGQKGRKNPTVAQPIYYLRAVVANRAWLGSNRGDTRTVKVGDKIPGYGVVRQIDATQGLVKTSSGKRILYGDHDA